MIRVDPTRAALGAAAGLVVAWAVLGAAAIGLGALLVVSPLALAVGGLIILGREHPVLCVVVAFLGLMIGSDAGGREVENAFLIGLLVACFLVGRFGQLAQLPWLGALVLLLISGALAFDGPSAGDAAFPVLFTVGPCVLGIAVQLASSRESEAHSRVRLLDAMRLEEVRRTAVEERLRIARDLHDLLAHDISAVSLQAQVLRREADAGRVVDGRALRAIEETARQAMTDARHLLGVLRVGDTAATEPAPELADVDRLVGRLAELGQRVEVGHIGDARRLPPALSQTAFRIVQEALTNSRRHGAGGATTLDFHWAPSELRMVVSNATHRADSARPGHGTAGILERARLFGGDATIGEHDGRWTVDVVLPLPGGRR